MGLIAEQFLAWVDQVCRPQVVGDVDQSEKTEYPEFPENICSPPPSSENVEGEGRHVIVTLYERSRATEKPASIITTYRAKPAG